MAEITVCVPVYNAAAFVEKTLQCIAAQSLGDIRVLLSIDQSSDDSEAICRAFCKDERFQVIAHRERQGWVKNCNALIAAVDTEFFAIIPHDDLLHSTYLEVLRQALDDNQDAVTAYSDIEIFGARKGKVRQPGMRGDRFHRMLDFFLNQRASVAFRGLVRRRSADDRPYLLENLPRDYAADTVWLLQLAIGGELIRVPRALYRKRMHEANTHETWTTWTGEEKISIWADQCATCAKMALDQTTDPEERQLLLLAAMLRLLGAVPSRPIFTLSPRTLDRALLSARFGSLIGEQDWPVDGKALLRGERAAPISAAIKALTGENALREGKPEEAIVALKEAVGLDPLSEQAAMQLEKAQRSFKAA